MISINAPTKNRAIVPVSMGTTKMESRSTITVIGRTAFTDSSNFSLSFLFKMASHYFLF
jgi:hypothetical protein